MVTIKEISKMCKGGQVAEAYGLAKADYEAAPTNVWAQRAMGWALYYMLKNDTEKKERQLFYDHLEELARLNLLTMQTDTLIFDNVVWKLVELIKQIPLERTDEIERIYSFLCKYAFSPSKGYSVLLKQLSGFDTWNRLVEFFEWWNIDNLMPEDYIPFQMENGNKVMSLAEQVYIAYSKALLRLNDKERIRDFVPKIEKLMEDYPDMMYPGYFCGKLKLAMGAERESALDIIMPFVRKKKTEFWVWQLLHELYQREPDIQLACLLRAVHCKTKEAFLGKVRMKLVSIFVQRKDYPRAKFHLDKMIRCYMQQGWHLPYEVQTWMKEGWVNNTSADSSDGVDYIQHTDAILTRGASKNIAVVTYVDYARRLAWIVYGEKKRTNVPLSNFGIKVKEGALLELQYLPGADGRITVVGTQLAEMQSLKGVSYIQVIKGKISKHKNNPFAFIINNNLQCYIKPEIVQKHHIHDNEAVTVLAVLDFNKKKDNWNWTCVSLIR